MKSFRKNVVGVRFGRTLTLLHVNRIDGISWLFDNSVSVLRRLFGPFEELFTIDRFVVSFMVDTLIGFIN